MLFLPKIRPKKMQFSQIIGQSRVKDRLQNMLRSERVPHALLFCGCAGCGQLPMALAMAHALLCRERAATGGDEACGHCRDCKMSDGAVHPDLHFVFPVINKNKDSENSSVSDDFLPQWREQLADTPYFDLKDWLARMGDDKKQAAIFRSEANAILSKLSIVASQGGARVVIVWLPELMGAEPANALLKILEEPTPNTYFLLVSERDDLLLETIRSRTQRIEFPPLGEAEVAAALEAAHHVDPDAARSLAHAAEGSYTEALHRLRVGDDSEEFFEMFVQLMRLAYARKVKDLKLWSEQVAAWSRNRQRDFLDYCGRALRENFVYNFHRPELNFETADESAFSRKFAPFINERNVWGIFHEIEQAEQEIRQNANSKIVLFDFCLKIIVLLTK